MTNVISKEINFTLFNEKDLPADFMPWGLGQKGRQIFLKLSKEGKASYLYIGETALVPAQTQKILAQLLRDGWRLEGKAEISFDGKMLPEVNILFDRDLITLEVGHFLLPLVDSANGAPLLGALGILREEFAVNTGFLIPGINIKDNFALAPNEYVLKVRSKPLAKGEVFLERFMVLAPAEKLNKLKGWTTHDPSFNVQAKWIEESEKKAAEEGKCLIISPLNVLITHVKETIKNNFKEILGLQELRHLIEHIYGTYPVVAEDFLKDINCLRKLRIILGNLLAEGVIIKDIISILEIVGDNIEQINNTDFLTEIVRMNLAAQICWPYADSEGKLKVFCFERAFEAKLLDALAAAVKAQKSFVLTQDEVDEVIISIKEAVNLNPEIKIILVPPQLRLFLSRLLAGVFTNLVFISTAEAANAKANLRIAQELKHKKIVTDKEKKKTKKGLWGKRNK